LQNHINHRKKIKSRKPTFLAQDVLHRKRIRPRWKRPKGLQSKMRLNHAGQPANVSQGWRSPRSIRGFSSEGLQKIRVHNVADLQKIDAKTQGALIASNVSIKNKEKIYAECDKLKITVLNRNAKDFKKSLDEWMKKRKDHKKTIDTRRKKRATEKEKKDDKKSAEKSDSKDDKIKNEVKKTDAAKEKAPAEAKEEKKE